MVAGAAAVLLGALSALFFFTRKDDDGSPPSAARSLDGSGNNIDHPAWGRIGRPYLRVARPNYADGMAGMVDGPTARYISNRVFNDLGQNLFSENGVSQRGWVWGQFLDHTFGLRDERPRRDGPDSFDARIRRALQDDLGTIDFARTPAALGTGKDHAAAADEHGQSFIDASPCTAAPEAARVAARRARSTESCEQQRPLLLPGGYLPQAKSRGNDDTAPGMDLMGPLVGHSRERRRRGRRAGEREHRAHRDAHAVRARAQPDRLAPARHAVEPGPVPDRTPRRRRGAAVHHVPRSSSRRSASPPAVPRLQPERRPGALERVRDGRLPRAQHGARRVRARRCPRHVPAGPAGGVPARKESRRGEGKNVTLVIPLGVAFGNPDLLETVGLGPTSSRASVTSGSTERRADRRLDAQRPVPDPEAGHHATRESAARRRRAGCFPAVQDLGAIDIERGRDHGIPPYNELRVAYGLEPKTRITAITGEQSAEFPRNRLISRRDPIDDPDILAFTS